MKDKDVKKMLSEGSRQVLPSGEIKREIKRRIGVDEEQTVYLGGAGAKIRSKKPLIILAVFAAVIAVLCAVLIPYYTKNRGTSPLNPNIIATEPVDEFYVYGAASVGALLSAQEQTTATAAVGGKSVVKSAVKSSSVTFQEVVDLLDEYMPFVDGLMSGGEITAVTVDKDENYSDYEYSILISYPHMDGGYSAYVLYYNRELSEIKTDGGETEEKYNIDGVLCVDGVDYVVKGAHETETEGNESEEEITFTVYKDGLPYIRLEQETEQEDGETELGYMYTFYSGGKVYKTVEVEYEEEDGEAELSLAVTVEGSEYEFKFILDSGTKMTVKAECDGGKYTITVTIVDGVYYYS